MNKIVDAEIDGAAPENIMQGDYLKDQISPDIRPVSRSTGEMEWPLLEGKRQVTLFIANRNWKTPRLETMFAIAMTDKGLWLGVVKDYKRNAVPGRAYILLLKMFLADNRDQLGQAHIEVNLPSRDMDRGALMVELRRLTDLEDEAPIENQPVAIADGITMSAVSPGEAMILPHQRLECMRSVFSNEEELDGEEIASLLPLLHETLSIDRSIQHQIIDDDRCIKHEDQGGVYAAPPALLTGPRNAVIGLAGSGKSSLVSAMLGLQNHDLPPSGASRTTLAPINFAQRASDHFEIHVKLRSPDEVREQIRKLVERTMIVLSTLSGSNIDHFINNGVSFIAKHEGVMEALTRSPDSTFDLRLIFGRLSRGGIMADTWVEIIDMVHQGFHDIVLDLGSRSHVPLHEIDERHVADHPQVEIIAEGLLDLVAERIEQIGYGRLVPDESGLLATTYRYASSDMMAAFSAARRFISTSKRHAGRVFSPIAAEVTISGPFLRDVPDFVITDNRGFDHEGRIGEVAGADVLETIRQSDRVVVIEDANKSGDRATMSLVAHIVSAGDASKVYFAQTKVDDVALKGVDPGAHIRDGIINGLNAISAVVGHDAVEEVKKNVSAEGVFSFANLHEIHGEPGRGILDADDAGDHDNASHARRLIRLLACEEAAPASSQVHAAGPVFASDDIRQAVSNALDETTKAGIAYYGDEGMNQGGSVHWNTIKWEVRNMLRTAVVSDPHEIKPQCLALTSYMHDALLMNISGAIDAPVSWRDSSGFVLDDASATTQRRDAVRNTLRRQMLDEIHRLAVNTTIFEFISKWREADMLSQDTFGPGSTYKRAELIREIMAQLRGYEETLTLFITSELRSLGAHVLDQQEEIVRAV